MSKPETMSQLYLKIVEQKAKIPPKIDVNTRNRAMHWGVVSALLSLEQPDVFSTALLDAVVDRYRDTTVDAIATNGSNELIVADYRWLSGGGVLPVLGFAGSSLYFGLSREGLPDFEIASTRS